MSKVPVIHDWRYMANHKHAFGYTDLHEENIGWYCWIYTDDIVDIKQWMKDNIKGKYDCTFRFNSGDPMYTVYIADNEDATLFKLTWAG